MDTHVQLEGLNVMHFILAYAGMILSLLMKLGEEYSMPDFTFKKYFKKYFISILFSVIAIPVLLIVATDTSISDFLPINYVTAVLCGWQTQAIFKSTFIMVANRRGLNGNSNANSNGNNNDTPPSNG